jgi:hypothetical protein
MPEHCGDVLKNQFFQDVAAFRSRHAGKPPP